MRSVVALLTILISVTLNAQTTSTLCGTEEVRVFLSTVDLRLVGCGEGFASNLLWHLDRADSRDGTLDNSVTRKATGKGAVVYMCEGGIMRDHDEFMRADGSVVIGSTAVSYAAPYVSGIAALLLEKNPDLTPVELEQMIKTKSSHVANSDEVTARGRVAMFDWIFGVPGRRPGRR